MLCAAGPRTPARPSPPSRVGRRPRVRRPAARATEPAAARAGGAPAVRAACREAGGCPFSYTSSGKDPELTQLSAATVPPSAVGNGGVSAPFTEWFHLSASVSGVPRRRSSMTVTTITHRARVGALGVAFVIVAAGALGGNYGHSRADSRLLRQRRRRRGSGRSPTTTATTHGSHRGSTSPRSTGDACRNSHR